MRIIKQLTGNDYDMITNYFEEVLKDDSKGFVDPYIVKSAEFSAYAIKDNLFNYRRLFFSNESNTEMICFKFRKKPLNSLIIDLIYFDSSVNENFIEKLNSVFDNIKSNYEGIGKINICLTEENSDRVINYLQELNFSCEVTYYDEFGQGNNILVYSRYL